MCWHCSKHWWSRGKQCGGSCYYFPHVWWRETDTVKIVFLSRSGGEKGLRGSGAGNLGIPLGGPRRVGGLLGVAGRLSGTVSPFRAEQGTSLETPWRARARVATREESGVLGFPSRRGLTPRGSLECNPDVPAPWEAPSLVGRSVGTGSFRASEESTAAGLGQPKQVCKPHRG